MVTIVTPRPVAVRRRGVFYSMRSYFDVFCTLPHRAVPNNERNIAGLAPLDGSVCTDQSTPFVHYL